MMSGLAGGLRVNNIAGQNEDGHFVLICMTVYCEVVSWVYVFSVIHIDEEKRV